MIEQRLQIGTERSGMIQAAPSILNVKSDKYKTWILRQFVDTLSVNFHIYFV